jgi:phosphoribosylamine--glycine ligase
MKEVLDAAGVPTAKWVAGTLSDKAKLHAFAKDRDGKVAIKTDGLAAGKGVLVSKSVEQASKDIDAKLSGEAFGDAGKIVVVEELLSNPNNPSDPAYYELSVFVATNGKGESAIFQLAQDFKRLRDNDEGPNTGGMGSYSPVPAVSNQMLQDIYQTCIKPVEQELIKRNIDYRGFLFCGIMMTPDGPKVLEYNVRFGDPEAQSVLPRVSSNLVELLTACAKGEKPTELKFSDDAVVAVVLAAKNYAEGDVPAGDVITGIDKAKAMNGVSVYCAGTGENDHGELVTAGGRIVAVSGRGKDLEAARALAYKAAELVNWSGKQSRTDIGPKAN